MSRKLLDQMNEIEFGQVEISKQDRNAEVEEFNKFILAVGEKAKTSGRLGKKKLEDFFDGTNPKHNAIAAMSNKDIYESLIPVVIGQLKVGMATADEHMQFDDAIVSAWFGSQEATAYWELLNSKQN